MGASCALGWPVKLEVMKKGAKKITKAFWRTDVKEEDVKLFFGFNINDYKVRPCQWRTVFVGNAADVAGAAAGAAFALE